MYVIANIKARKNTAGMAGSIMIPSADGNTDMVLNPNTLWSQTATANYQQKIDIRRSQN